MKGFGLYLTVIGLCLLFIVYSTFSYGAATEEKTIVNGDGSFTFIQKITSTSSVPHYHKYPGFGFSVYSWFDEDYGWQHDFPLWNDENIKITSAKILVRGWDIDSEPSHGTDGEYDGISIDGIDLNPELLQGTNNNWSETEFNVPLNTIADDGLINTDLRIDMNHTFRKWATTLDFSLLTITYIESANSAPYQPQLAISPANSVGDADDLVVNIVNSSEADPDGDAVSYYYRWYVDVGQGFFVDDEFAGKQDHQGPVVRALQTLPGERWKVEVCPADSNHIMGPSAIGVWHFIGETDE